MRLLLRIGGAVIMLVLVAAAAIWVQGSRIVTKKHQFTARPVPVPMDARLIAEGERLAHTRGCFGCHGQRLDGQVFFDEPAIARIVAPNLTVARTRYSDAQLEVVIRHGVRADGRNNLIMPSDMFYFLSDPDLTAILSYLRSVPEVPDTLPGDRIGPLGRFGLVTGKFKTIPSQIDHAAPQLIGSSPGASQIERGRYLALSTCTECHGRRLEGNPSDEPAPTPGLAIVAGYPEEAFRTLMRTGRPLDGRELGLMKSVALGRTRYFTDDELAALYAYLRTLASGRVT